MKLGTQTGSLFNHIMSNTSVKEIIPGKTGATLLGWSDRHAATVIDVFTKGVFDYIVVQRDKATRVETKNLMSDTQTYTYEADPEGQISTFRIGKTGNFEQVYINEDTGRYVKANVGGLLVGKRKHYFDYSF
jgi:hypothetical protein